MASERPLMNTARRLAAALGDSPLPDIASIVDQVRCRATGQSHSLEKRGRHESDMWTTGAWPPTAGDPARRTHLTSAASLCGWGWYCSTITAGRESRQNTRPIHGESHR